MDAKVLRISLGILIQDAIKSNERNIASLDEEFQLLAKGDVAEQLVNTSALTVSAIDLIIINELIEDELKRCLSLLFEGASESLSDEDIARKIRLCAIYTDSSDTLFNLVKELAIKEAKRGQE